MLSDFLSLKMYFYFFTSKYIEKNNNDLATNNIRLHQSLLLISLLQLQDEMDYRLNIMLNPSHGEVMSS